MPYLNGAQATIATLRAYHVDTIFGIPGAHTLPLYDALGQEPVRRAWQAALAEHIQELHAHEMQQQQSKRANQQD